MVGHDHVAFIRLYVCVNMSVFIHAPVCMCICMHAFIVCMHDCARSRGLHSSVCMCMCMCMWKACCLYMHTYIHTYMCF